MASDSLAGMAELGNGPFWSLANFSGEFKWVLSQVLVIFQ